MVQRRQAYQLTNTSPSRTITLDFIPNTLSILNTTKFPVYVLFGASIPGKLNFDEIIAPFSSFVADPVGNQIISINVDNQSDKTYTFPFPVNIIVSTGAASSQSAISPNLISSGVTPYLQKLLLIEPSNLIDVWVLDDLLPSIAVDRVSSLRNGAYFNSPIMSAVYGPDGVTRAPIFDGGTPGVGNHVNVFSGSLASLFSGAVGSLFCWGQLTTSKWGDANVYALACMAVDNNNRVEIIKNNANTIQADYVAAGTPIVLSSVISPGNGWFILGMTWSKTLNRVRMYYNGVQQGGDAAIGAPTFSGSPLAVAKIGANNVLQWDFPGSLANCALWSVELTPSEVLQISTAP